MTYTFISWEWKGMWRRGELHSVVIYRQLNWPLVILFLNKTESLAFCALSDA